MEAGARMFPILVGVVAALCVYGYFTSQARTPLHTFLALCIGVLAVLPGLIWLKSPRTAIPVFAVFMLPLVNTHALPLLNGHADLLRYSEATITFSAVLVLVFELVAMGTYYRLRFRPCSSRFWSSPLGDGFSPAMALSGLSITLLYDFLTAFTTIIPHGAISSVRPLFSGIGMLSTFALMYAWGQDKLDLHIKVVAVLVFVAGVLVRSTSLLLISSLMSTAIALIAYTAASRRIPFLALIASVLAFGILHAGKDEMRDVYWGKGKITEKKQVTFGNTPEFYAGWIAAGLSPAKTTQTSATGRLVDRSSLFHMLTLVVHYSPERVPHMYGDTYNDIIPQLVPRVVWSDKPLGSVSMAKLSVRYGLLREEETSFVSIAFGLIAEAYANFGTLGIAMLAVVMAAGLRWVSDFTLDAPLTSLCGILLILVTAWSLQTESPMSSWLGSLFQAACAMVGVPALYKRLFG